MLTLDAAAYAREGFDTAPGASAGAPAIARDLRVVPVTFRPVHYDAARKVLRVSRQVRVRIDFAGRDLTNALARTSDFIPESFDRLYRAMVVNYAPRAAPLRATEPRAAAPRSASAPGSSSARTTPTVTTRLQPLIDWRQREGYTVTLATTAETGTTDDLDQGLHPERLQHLDAAAGVRRLGRGRRRHLRHPHLVRDLSGESGEGDHPYTPARRRRHPQRRPHRAALLQHPHRARDHRGQDGELRERPRTSGRSRLVHPRLPGGRPAATPGYSSVQVMQWIKTRLRQIGYTQIDTVFSGNFVSQMSTALNRGDTIFCLPRLLRVQRLDQQQHLRPDQHQQAPLRRHQHLRDRLLRRRDEQLRGLPARGHRRRAQGGGRRHRHRHHRHPHPLQQLLHLGHLPGAALRGPVGDGRGPHPRQVRALPELLARPTRTRRPASALEQPHGGPGRPDLDRRAHAR